MLPRRLCAPILASVLALSLSALAVQQETKEAEGKTGQQQKSPAKKGEQLAEATESALATYPVTTSCYVSDGGHRWNINASNTASRSYIAASRVVICGRTRGPAQLEPAAMECQQRQKTCASAVLSTTRSHGQ